MLLTGNLKEYSLPEILLDINRKRLTGTLSVTAAGFTKNICFNDGNAVFASSTLEDDRLGEMLVKAGKINIEQYKKSVELLKASGKRQGAILVELGHITPKDLFWGVKYQVKEIIYSLFQLGEGAYEFKESALPSDEGITLRIGMENLIYEGVRRIDNLTIIRKKMPDAGTVFKVNDDPAAAFRRIDLSPQDKTILSLVDGERTINRLIDASHINSFEVMRTLYVLWLTGFIVEKKLSEHVNEDTVNLEDITEPVSEEERALKEKAEWIHERLGSMSEAELLQVDENTDSETVKRNYYRMVKEFHPDRVYNSSDRQLKDKLVVIFDAVSKAYNILKDDTKRKGYFKFAGDMPKKHEEDTHALLIEEQFSRGIEEFKRNNLWAAVEIFRWITREDPKNPRAWSYLSLALSRIPHKLKEAEEALIMAVKLEPFNSDHFANLGLIYLKAGLKKRAQYQFEKALRLDPENDKARKGLEQAISAS